MTLLTPVALWGLLLIPVLIVFYFFRPEPRQKQSNTHFLWKQAIPDSQGGSFAKRLQSNPLLWLQFLVMLLLILFLGRLSVPLVNRTPISSRVILIIDRSASMSAGGAFDSAVRKAEEAVDSMLGFRLTGTTPEIMLIAVDREPQVLVPFSKDAGALKAALAQLRPTDLPDDLESLEPFLRSLLKAHKAKIWFVGDHLPESLHLPGVQFTSVAVSDNNNVGIVSFSVSGPDPSRGQNKPFVYARVENFSDSAQHRLLKIEKMRANSPEQVEAVVREKTLLLSAQSGQTIVESLSASRFETDKPSLFRFRLLPMPGESRDIFPSDDEAYTVVEPFGNERVIVATAGGTKATFLLRAIAASKGIKLMSLEQLTALPDPPPIDLLLAPANFQAPSKLKVRSRFLLAPEPNKNEEAQVGRLSLSEREAPLVADSGVEWERMKVRLTDFTPLKKGEIELLRSTEGPALSLSGLNEGLPSLHWRFPLAHSSLPLSTGLPVIVGRFIDQYSRNSDVPVVGSMTTSLPVKKPSGHKWRGNFALRPLTDKAKRLEPQRTIPTQSSVIEPPKQVGFYSLLSSSGNSPDPLAVNLFSYQESQLPRNFEDLDFEEEENRQTPQTTKIEQLQHREITTPLLALALLLLLLEAGFFLKRGRP